MKLEGEQNNNTQYVCCEPESYDDVYIVPTSKSEFGYKTVLRQIRSVYDIAVINSGTIPDSKNKTPLIIRVPDKKGGVFKLYIKREFMIKNDKDFLNLLKDLFSKKIIKFIRGVISYDIGYTHHFINLQTFLDNKDIPVMYRICRNFDDINCVFKHKDEVSVTMFCEIISRIYPFEEPQKVWNYSVDYFKDDDRSSALTDFFFSINNQGNVKVEFDGEKLNILAREFYAKNLEEGLKILTNEMKNLGFNIKIVEKRRIR